MYLLISDIKDQGNIDMQKNARDRGERSDLNYKLFIIIFNFSLNLQLKREIRNC